MCHRRRFVGLAIALLCGLPVPYTQQTPPASQAPPLRDNAPSPQTKTKNKNQPPPASLDRLELAGPHGQDVETICNSLLAALGFVSSLSQTQITLTKKSPAGETPATYLLTDGTIGQGVLEKDAWVRVCYREADQKRTAVVIEVLEPAPAATDATVGTLKKGTLPGLGAGNKAPDEDPEQTPSPRDEGQRVPTKKKPPGPGGPETAGQRGAPDDEGHCAGSAVARGLVTSVSATGLVLEENTPHGPRQSPYIRGRQTKEDGVIRPGVRAVICYSESAGKRTAIFVGVQGAAQ